MSPRNRYLVMVAAAGALAVAFSGCNKKASEEDMEFSSTKAAAAKKPADVFDEFYMDDGKKAKAGAPAAEPSKQALASVSGSYTFKPNGRYVVQVNSTASQGGADQLVSKLKGLGYPAYTAQVENPTPELTGLYYRVRIGGFDSVSEAKSFAENTLVQAGYEYWVDRKANDNVGIQGGGFGSGGSQQQYNQYQAPAPAPQHYQQAPPPPQHQPAQAPPPQQFHPAQAPPPQQFRPAQAPPPQQFHPAPPPQQQQYRPAPAQAPPPPPPPPPPQQAQPDVPSDWGADDWGSDDW